MPGYRFISVLGSGGFSDVYLYEQDRPRRKVAVKVLTADLKTAGARSSFESEANLMAQLSAHPYIVTIFEAEITDSGHSYLAMEYCSRPSLDVQYRQGRSSVDRALEVGIQVASAVETAHRAGIAHRDIKPANVLVTDYNRPALTDFGISGTMDGEQSEGGGMSIPWSPPESFGAGATDGVKVDIWALGATIYTLLAGHSPFVIPGADNSQRMLMDRIASAPLPGLGRADVPEALERVLATAMAKSPASRYASAKDFARALMRVQTELNLSVTPFEVRDDVVSHEVRPDDHHEATRVRSVVSIDPEAPTANPTFPTRDGGSRTTGGGSRGAVPRQGPASGATANPRDNTTGNTTGLIRNGQTVPGTFPHAPAAPAPGIPGPGAPAGPPGAVEDTVARPAEPAAWHGGPAQGAEHVLDSTVQRGAPALAEDLADPHGQPAPGVGGRKRLWLGLASGLVLAAAVVIGVVVFTNQGAPTAPETPVASGKPSSALVVGAPVPAVADLAAAPGDGGSEWTWTNPDPQDGDAYLWAPISAVSTGEYKRVAEAKVFVANGADDKSCISVKLLRKSGETSPETKKCS
nr:serine/threonine-protein kinase [Arthrobacter stackebrandtii]